MNIKKIFAGVAAAGVAAFAMASASFAAEIALGGEGKMTDEGGVRLTVFNPWGDDDMKLIDWAEVEGTQLVSVKFKVSGVADPFTAELNISNFNDINYWGAGDSSNANVTTEALTVSADGVYVLTAELDVPYAIGDNNFLSVQTDIDAGGDETLANVPQFSLVAVAVDEALAADAADNDAAADTDTSDTDSADTDSSTDADNGTDDTAADTTTEAAPAGNGDTAAAAADKSNADTGVAGIALAAALAVVATGVIVVANKRK